MEHGLEGRDKIKRDADTRVRGLEERTKRMGLVVSDKKETCAVSKKLRKSGTLEGVEAVDQELTNADNAVTREFQTVWQELDSLIAENERAKRKLECGKVHAQGNVVTLGTTAERVTKTQKAKQDLRGGKRESVKDVHFCDRVGKQQDAGIRRAKESRSAHKQTLQSTKLDNNKKEIGAAIRWAQNDRGGSSAAKKEAPAEITVKSPSREFVFKVPDAVTDIAAGGNNAYGRDETGEFSATTWPETVGDTDLEGMMAKDMQPQQPQDTHADLSSEEPKVGDTLPWPDYIRKVETYKPKKYQ